MVDFLLLSTIDNTRELREALAEIRAEYGEILSVKKSISPTGSGGQLTRDRWKKR